MNIDVWYTGYESVLKIGLVLGIVVAFILYRAK